MKTAKQWAARIEGDRKTPWAELVKMIQDDALSGSAKEIRDTWHTTTAARGQMEAYRIMERMVDRLGYGRTENNPSLCKPMEEIKSEIKKENL